LTAGYSTAGWGELFLAAAGATAALSGLIFVGLSVNLRTVLELDRRQGGNFLTGRALEALVALLNVLVVSLVALTPAIPHQVLAAFIFVVAAESATSPIKVFIATRHEARVSGTTYLRLLTATALTLTLALAAITLAVGNGGGLYWLPASFVLAVFIAAVNAWILLVEVLR
jgi:hypothetical protein